MFVFCVNMLAIRSLIAFIDSRCLGDAASIDLRNQLTLIVWLYLLSLMPQCRRKVGDNF